MPHKLPPCVIQALQRPEWFPDLRVCGSARIQILRLPRFVRRAPAAMTLGVLIVFLRPEHWRPTDPAGLALLAHELWHVHQYRVEGYLRFSLKYLSQWWSLVAKRKPIHQHLSYEVEAMRFQRFVEGELRRERAVNVGAGPCLAEGGRLQINPSYRRVEVAIWRP